jgi:hypothetical protein
LYHQQIIPSARLQNVIQAAKAQGHQNHAKVVSVPEKCQAALWKTASGKLLPIRLRQLGGAEEAPANPAALGLARIMHDDINFAATAA